METGQKSALIVGSKKQIKQEIQYKTASGQQVVGGLSDQQKQAQFLRQHEEYMKVKQSRKKQLLKAKFQEFGPSSSDQSSSSQQQIALTVPKIKNKQIKKSFQDSTNYEVKLQLKKLSIECALNFKQTEFQINKQIIQYTRINKLNLVAQNGVFKLKLGLIGSQDLIIIGSKQRPIHLIQIFVKFLKIKITQKQIKFKQLQQKIPLSEFGQISVGSIICDLIPKKSQIIGNWQERYVVIRPQGLYSYRSLKGKATMQIDIKEIKQVQTSFQMYKDQLVIQLKYGSTKTDFGIPIDNNLIWAEALANLISLCVNM